MTRRPYSARPLASWTTLFGILILASCHASESVSTDVVFDTMPSGTVIVRNGPIGLWAEGKAWRLEEEWRVGELDLDAEVAGTSDDREFMRRPTTILKGPNGQTFVLDLPAGAILVFDHDGNMVRRFGRSGEGPGEISTPLAMSWDSVNHELWIVDYNQRYTVFDSTGDYLRTVRRDLRPIRFMQRLLFDGDHGFVDEAGTGGGAIQFVRIDTSGTVVDSIAPVTLPQTARLGLLPGTLRGAEDFVPLRVYSVTATGSMWLGTSNEFRLIHRSPSGDTLRIIETSHRDIPLTADEERAIREVSSRSGISETELGLGRRILQGIHVMDDGHLLVQIEEVSGEPGSSLDVFDPEGRFLGTMEGTFAMTPRTYPAIHGDTLIATSRGEYDIPLVVRATIVRPD